VACVFPSPLFLAPMTDGSWKGSAKVVGATLADRFSDIILLGAFRKALSTRCRACALLHGNPGSRQSTTVQLIREFDSP
jgi:hypothetical protein